MGAPLTFAPTTGGVIVESPNRLILRSSRRNGRHDPGFAGASGHMHKS
jgi:hypothetical protein